VTDDHLTIELERDGKVAVLEVHAHRALVGSASHCDLRLDLGDAAPEQLLLELVQGKLLAHDRGPERGLTLRGAPFVSIELDRGDTLELGRTTLRAHGAKTRTKRPDRDGFSIPPRLQAVLLLLLGFGWYYVLSKHGTEADSPVWSSEPPRLFDHALPSCPQQDAEHALMLAQQQESAAEFERERSPFFPREGVSAVTRYQRAAACFQVAGQSERAAAASASARTLQGALESEYHIRRLRLERALEGGKYEQVPREVRVLSEFVATRSAPYAQWLAQVARESELRLNASGEEE
jgi:hypothetical protein